MRVKSSGVKSSFFLCLFLLVALVGPTFSDTVDYIYDDLGRLMMTRSSNGAVVVYSYDWAGHIISVTRTTASQQLPVLTGITPTNVFIGNEVSISISGNNLLDTKSVTTDNPGIRIVTFSASNNSVTIDAIVGNTASVGPATFTVTTLYGSASKTLNLLNLVFTPSSNVLAPGASESVTARIDGLTSDYNLVLTNQNPAVISAPQSVTVPVAGNATFIINTLSQGAGVITAGNSGISVFVSAPFTGSGTASSTAVSVFINDSYQSGSSVSVPVSAEIGGYFNGGAVVNNPLVSVKIKQ